MDFCNSVVTELPRELYIEVTNRCNSRCQACVRTFRRLEPQRDLELREFRSLVDQFPVLNRVVLHGIGEPLLHVELVDMIRYLKGRHPSAVALFNSNAVLLDEGWRKALIEVGLDQFRISMDAATASIYAQIRGIDAFDRAIENTRQFATALRGMERPRLSFWLTAMRENLPELPALVDLAAEIGVPEVYVQRLVLTRRGLAQEDHSLYGKLRAQEESFLAEAERRAQSHGLDFRASGLSTPQQSLQRRRAAVGEGETDPHMPWFDCHRPWRMTYVTANGNVLPCCIAPFSATDYGGLILGNIFDKAFPEIWNGTQYVERRTALRTAHPLSPCEECGMSWSL